MHLSSHYLSDGGRSPVSHDTYPSTVQDEIARIRKMPIVERILTSLHSKLPPNLKYHSAAHTENVLSEVIYFAVTDGLSPREIELLGVAASYHDAGFLVQYQDNEEVGAAMVSRAMQDEKSYSDAEIELTRKMILDTRLIDNAARYADRPSSKLARYLLDADMSNLGREDFFDKVRLIAQEFGADERMHMENTYQLVTNHCWLTPAAQKFRSEQKEKNVKKLAQMLGKPS